MGRHRGQPDALDGGTYSKAGVPNVLRCTALRFSLGIVFQPYPLVC